MKIQTCEVSNLWIGMLSYLMKYIYLILDQIGNGSSSVKWNCTALIISISTDDKTRLIGNYEIDK